MNITLIILWFISAPTLMGSDQIRMQSMNACHEARLWVTSETASRLTIKYGKENVVFIQARCFEDRREWEEDR